MPFHANYVSHPVSGDDYQAVCEASVVVSPPAAKLLALSGHD